MNIIAAAIVRNVSRFIPDVIESLAWADRIVVCDDHSSDDTSSLLHKLGAKDHHLAVIRPWYSGTMFESLPNGRRNISRELTIRNQFIKRLFDQFTPDAVLLFDGDELFSSALKKYICHVVGHEEFDSIALTCNHLFSRNYYLHVYENNWNGVSMVDPHVRVITKVQLYQSGEWEEVPDCMLKHTKNTLCLDGAYHYHLKYCERLHQINHSLRSLPNHITLETTQTYMRLHRFPFPSDLHSIIEKYV